MNFQPFNRSKHVYKNDALEDLLKDTIRFVNGTPVQPLNIGEKFIGAGVYTLYYCGQDPLYARIGQMNRMEYKAPIYVGKAVPVQLAEILGKQMYKLLSS